MLTVLAGTNRPDSNTKRVADRVVQLLAENTSTAKEGPVLLDLQNLPQQIFSAASYAEKPAQFLEEFQTPIDEASGLLIVTPEYNGSFPGVLKYFIDMLDFPKSLKNLPIAFVGVAAGQWGAMRSIEQLTLIVQYRSAHVFGTRLFIPRINDVLQDDGTLGDYEPRLGQLVEGFVKFVGDHQ